MKQLLFLLCLGVPGILFGGPKVLVNAIPTGGAFMGVTPIGLPFRDAEKENPKNIEAGLNAALAGFLPGASQQGFSYICLLSAPGDQPIEIPISAATASIKLSRTHTAVFVLFYRGGHEMTNAVSYSSGGPEPKTAHVSSSFRLISVPQGGSIEGWIYFNLPRIQAEAEKAKSPIVFLQTDGVGALTPVPIPGMKDPLMVHKEQVTFTASWYMDPKMNDSHQGEIFGHPLPAETPNHSAEPTPGAVH